MFANIGPIPLSIYSDLHGAESEIRLHENILRARGQNWGQPIT